MLVPFISLGGCLMGSGVRNCRFRVHVKATSTKLITTGVAEMPALHGSKSIPMDHGQPC